MASTTGLQGIGKWVLVTTASILVVWAAKVLLSHPPQNTPVADAVKAVKTGKFYDSLVNAVIKDPRFAIRQAKVQSDSLFVAIDGINPNNAAAVSKYLIDHYAADTAAFVTTCLVYKNQPQPFTQAALAVSQNGKKKRQR